MSGFFFFFSFNVKTTLQNHATHTPPRPASPKCGCFAAHFGQVATLAYARTHGAQWETHTCSLAARGGHLAVLQWLRANGRVGYHFSPPRYFAVKTRLIKGNINLKARSHKTTTSYISPLI